MRVHSGEISVAVPAVHNHVIISIGHIVLLRALLTALRGVAACSMHIKMITQQAARTRYYNVTIRVKGKMGRNYAPDSSGTWKPPVSDRAVPKAAGSTCKGGTVSQAPRTFS